jgi:hypothetical protein
MSGWMTAISATLGREIGRIIRERAERKAAWEVRHGVPPRRHEPSVLSSVQHSAKKSWRKFWYLDD